MSLALNVGSHDLHPITTPEILANRTVLLMGMVTSIYLGTNRTDAEKELCGTVYHHLSIMLLHSDEGKVRTAWLNKHRLFNFDWQMATEESSGMTYASSALYIDAMCMSLASHNDHYRHRTNEKSLKLANEYYLSILRAYSEVAEKFIADDTVIELYVRTQLLASVILQERLSM